MLHDRREHGCGHCSCVSFPHLRLGTNAANVADRRMDMLHRLARLQGLRGHSSRRGT